MLKIIKIPLVLLIWPLVWYLSLRFVMYKYWSFDIVKQSSWQQLIETWNEGLILPWTFVAVLVFSIPVLIIVLVFLLKTNLTGFVRKQLLQPFVYMRKKGIQGLSRKTVKIKKRKSYMQIRPPALKPLTGEAFIQPRKHLAEIENITRDREMEEYYGKYMDGSRGAPRRTAHEAIKDDFKVPDFSKIKALNKDDVAMKPQDDDQDFNNRGAISPEDIDNSSIKEIVEGAGYRCLTDVKTGGAKIDAIAISSKAIVLLFEEKQAGEWLADEERFNDEEPLWFSESAQKVSPAYKALQIRNKVYNAIHTEHPEMVVVPILVISKGRIINASDMLDVWEELQVFVGRLKDGGPVELKRLSKLMPVNQDGAVDEGTVKVIEDKIKSIK